MPEFKQNTGRTLFHQPEEGALPDFGTSTADNLLIVWQMGQVATDDKGNVIPTGCLMIDVAEAMMARVAKEIECTSDPSPDLKKLQIAIGNMDGILQKLNASGLYI
jgi:hypothetical protein